MSMQVSLKKQILLGILFLFIITFSIEMTLRVYEYLSIPCSIYDNDAFKNLSYFEKKNICYDTNTLVHGKYPLYEIKPFQYKFTMNINSQGFRGPEITQDENNYKIFVTGGSTAFGFGSTADKHTIPGYLQHLFDNYNEDLNVEVINAGINGADSFREILYIKDKLISYNPDMIISYTGVNDSGGYQREIKLDEESSTGENLIKFSDFPWYRTPFVINNIIKNNIYDEEFKNSESQVIDLKIAGEVFEKNWSQSCELLKENNIKSILIIQPALVTKKSPSLFEEKILEDQYEERRDILEKFSKISNNLKCDQVLDLRYVLDDIKDTTYYDLVHMNDLGNEKVAEEIYYKILPIVKNHLIEKYR